MFLDRSKSGEVRLPRTLIWNGRQIDGPDFAQNVRWLKQMNSFKMRYPIVFRQIELWCELEKPDFEARNDKWALNWPNCVRRLWTAKKQICALIVASWGKVGKLWDWKPLPEPIQKSVLKQVLFLRKYQNQGHWNCEPSNKELLEVF